MGYIPIIKQHYPDELLYSWFYRLADINGLLIKDFSNAFLGTANANIGSLRIDIRKEYSSFYENMYVKPDVVELFLSTNTFLFDSAFMTEGQQARVIYNTFRKQDKLNRSINGLIKTINICPECMNEDIERFGEPYIHRCHNLSGVETCYKHHCMLKSFVGIKGHACDFAAEDYKEIQTNRTISSNNAYSEYVCSILQSNVFTNLKIMKEILADKISEIGYEKIFSDAKTWKYRDLIDYDIEKFLRFKRISSKWISATEFIPIFMLLYPDVRYLLSVIKERSEDCVIREYQCPNCGKTFVSTAYAFENLFGCPHCDKDKSEQEIFKEILDKNGYELKSEFESLDKHLSMRHKKCGRIFLIKPRAFLYENIGCICETQITFEEAKRQVEKTNKFQLLEFKNADSSCKIHAKECGHTFNVRYRKFLKAPQCRVCYPKTMTTDLLAERIKRKTNGEYALVGDFVDQDTKIKILHTVCGKITEYWPRYYHNGAKCPFCEDRFADQWEDMFQLLCEYKNKYGDANAPKTHNGENEKLGTWCQRQRRLYHANKLSDERSERLKSIGFSFDPLGEEWNRRYEQCRRYIDEHDGNADISRRTNYEGEHLGAWVDTQRKRYKQGKLSKERYERLRQLGVKLG